MKNFIFISPNFPLTYWKFCRELKNNGMRVLGIGDCPYDELMQELKEKKTEIGLAELFRSGMHIGKDTTGTMANTLVLAFAGSSFNMMILIYSYQVSFLQLMNTDFVAVELVRSVAGSLGIILTVPCVAIITAALLCRKQK